MLNSHVTSTFRKLLSELPEDVRKVARASYRLWRLNAWHPSLRFKEVNAKSSIYSVRVGIGYRALGVLRGDTVIWFWIGSHAAYDGIIRKL